MVVAEMTNTIPPNLDLRWEAKEVVRDIGDKPHLFQRIVLTGAWFPNRAEAPFVRVGEVTTRRVLIADDSASVRAYFDRPIPDGETIEFGYGDQVTLRFPREFSRRRLLLLDRERLPKGIVFMGKPV